MCVTVEFDAGTCVETNTNFDLVLPVAYTEFRPANQTLGVLGLVGVEGSDFFQFTIEANSTFVVVGTQVRGNATSDNNGFGCTFSVLVRFDEEECTVG